MLWFLKIISVSGPWQSMLLVLINELEHRVLTNKRFSVYLYFLGRSHERCPPKSQSWRDDWRSKAGFKWSQPMIMDSYWLLGGCNLHFKTESRTTHSILRELLKNPGKMHRADDYPVLVQRGWQCCSVHVFPDLVCLELLNDCDSCNWTLQWTVLKPWFGEAQKHICLQPCL